MKNPNRKFSTFNFQLSIIAAAIVGLAAAGCSKDKASEYTMILTVPAGEYKLYITGTGTATIDWGDGSSEQLAALNPLPANIENIPNYYIRYNYASAGVKNIKITGDNIHSLWTGITGSVTALNVSNMPTLKVLSFNGENLNSLDVSKNTALTFLNCNDNNLNSLDVSKNTALTYLNCDRNNLNSLNVSKNTALTYLSCYDNNLNSLDVSKNTALTELECSGNNLSSLDVSENIVLTVLNCVGNNLTLLNVSNCVKLKNLSCHNNRLSAAALTTVFTALPNRTGIGFGEIYVLNNPGVSQSGYNPSIATAKNWIVFD